MREDKIPISVRKQFHCNPTDSKRILRTWQEEHEASKFNVKLNVKFLTKHNVSNLIHDLLKS